MTAYYNEIDPKAAAWLRELIKAGAIAPGDVDERDIRDVRPSELDGFTQCHFFAGIGVWSYALRLAGWSDQASVWTGSCPCQPFSDAGKGGGFDDERHLWPAWFHLIEELRPPVIFGEQVASKDGLTWLDLVQTDMEATDYAFAPLDLCAAGVGTPHIRQRLYFVGDAGRPGSGRNPGTISSSQGARSSERIAARHIPDELISPSAALELGNAYHEGLEGRPSERGHNEPQQPTTERAGSAVCVVANLALERCGESSPNSRGLTPGDRAKRLPSGSVPGGYVNGFWGDAEWIYCRDEKYRPVEPGTFPLAHGTAARVGRLRGYGNGLVSYQAAAFIEAYMHC